MYKIYHGILLSLVPESLCSGYALHGPWDEFNLAPTDKSSRPNSIHTPRGNVLNQQHLFELAKTSGATTLSGNWFFAVLNFGQEIRPH